MPLTDTAAIEITAFKWVPPVAQGLVRDLRVRWALEEAGLDYRVELLGPDRPPAYLREQPFDQVPLFREGELTLFESGAIVQHIGERSEALLPRDPAARARAIQWSYAALNSVEPALNALTMIDAFYPGEEWAKARRPGAEQFARQKLARLATWLGDRPWLDGDRFTIGDLLMVTVLRIVQHSALVDEFANLAAYRARGEVRPAFKQAIGDQFAPYAANAPAPQPA
jgi:glutathione S-transferase